MILDKGVFVTPFSLVGQLEDIKKARADLHAHLVNVGTSHPTFVKGRLTFVGV